MMRAVWRGAVLAQSERTVVVARRIKSHVASWNGVTVEEVVPEGPR